MQTVLHRTEENQGKRCQRRLGSERDGFPQFFDAVSQILTESISQVESSCHWQQNEHSQEIDDRDHREYLFSPRVPGKWE
jgi:hypothetical protein